MKLESFTQAPAVLALVDISDSSLPQPHNLVHLCAVFHTGNPRRDCHSSRVGRPQRINQYSSRNSFCWQKCLPPLPYSAARTQPTPAASIPVIHAIQSRKNRELPACNFGCPRNQAILAAIHPTPEPQPPPKPGSPALQSPKLQIQAWALWGGWLLYPAFACCRAREG